MVESADAYLRMEQRKVAMGAVPALMIALAVYYIFGSRARTEALDWSAVETAIKAALAPALCVMASIGKVANVRFFSANDIGAGTSIQHSQHLDIENAILRNTLEQAFLAVILYVALATQVARPQPLIIALAALFVTGRLFFSLGYKRGAGGRAFGFGLTFYPSAIGLLYTAFITLR